MTKKKLFANNWKEYRDTPHEFFPEVPFDELMDWRVFGWELLPSHCCIIRVRTKNGKVKEYSYKRWTAARKKFDKLLNDPNLVELTIADEEEVKVMYRGTPDE